MEEKIVCKAKVQYGEVNTTDRFRKIKVRNNPKLKVGVSIKSDIMNLTVTCDDMDQEELLQLLLNYQRKKKYYRLKSGDLISVNESDMEMLQQLMETMQLSPKDFSKGDMKIPMYRALYLNKLLEQGENIYLNRDSHYKNLIKEFKTVDDSQFEVPDSLSTIMRSYQMYGFKWMKTLEHYGFGGILADDMGLGKTLQAISVLLDAKEQGKEGTSLIVCPASLVYNWKEEFTKYAPTLQVNLVVGMQQERSDIIQEYRKCDVLITSYDLLKRDIKEYEEAHFMYQILDEAQYIKNHGTAAAKSVKIIQSIHRLALTGTPIENRLSELWSIFDYLMPGFLYGYETFRKQLETPIVKNKDEEASMRLKKMVAPFILRRLKGNVLSDLPDKLEEIRYAKLEQEQQQLYDGQVIHMKKMLEAQKGEDFQKNKLQVLAELTKIRQICCDPALLFEKYAGGSAKREACMDLIQSAMEGEHKILVFSQFTSMLELLETELKKASIAYFKITGETPKQKRVEMVNTFNGDDTPVFLISLKAGGTGLNLTGADVVIHYDPWWNQAAQNQATDRAHRIGQTKAVSVYKLIVKGTIEEKIVKMQESKKDLADAILNGENGSIIQMSKEEFMELLEG
ncbi:MAG: DEAD/DEAH box helicase [Lachnospiraceae bacterium]|nr:DEAD/DEAH box helicase [Lachnospiraceae bacterium]